MTVSTEVNQAAYTGNGVTTVFPYTFRILNASNLTVTRINLLEVETVLTLGTDYTVTGAGTYNGGAVTLPQPLPSGYSLVIERDLAAVQETDLRNQGTFFAEVHEDVFDYLTMLVQQVTSWLGLALRRPTVKSKFYDSKGYRIANLAEPINSQDATTKSYVDKLNTTNLNRALRVPEPYVATVPGIVLRKNKLLAFNDAGNPIAVLPASGSASDVLIELAKPTGANLIGHRGATVSDILVSLLPGTFIDVSEIGNTTENIAGISGDNQIWLAWDKPSGALLSLVNNHDYGTATVTTSAGSYEFVTRQVFDLRVAGHVHGWGAAHNKDSTYAFVKMRNYIKSVGGGVIRFVAGETYLVTNHKEAGDGSYYGRSFVFDFKGAVINGLEIYGAGAKIKVADNSHYGSFDPSTGIAASVGTGGTVDHQNTPGTVFNFEGTISNITGWLPEINGNNLNMLIGGKYGDVDIQIQHTGLRLFGNVSNVDLVCSPIHHMGLDGIGINVATAAISGPSKISIINADCQYNGRQGLSLSGGAGVTFVNFKFSNTGMGGVSSAPRAGIDIEPEGGNFVLNPRFINGEILNNAGVGVLVWDPHGTVSGGAFDMTEIWGTAGHAMWLTGGNPNNKIMFERCGIHGQIPHAKNAILGAGCNVDDDEHPAHGTYITLPRLLADLENVTIRDCVIDVKHHMVAEDGADWQNVRIYCRWDGPTISSVGGTAITFGGKVQDVVMYDLITNVTTETQRFWATGLSTVIGGVSSLSIKGNGALRYNSQTGQDGDIPLTQLLGVRLQSFGTELSGVRRILGVSLTTPTSAIGFPVSGTPYHVQVGDEYLNGAPDSGMPNSWVMVPSGIWKSTGTL